MIFNPVARGERAATLQSQLAELSSTCSLRPTDAPGAARQMAADAVAAGFTTIIAAGGDGTINEVVNGIADSPEALQHVRLGILPSGTANVFAKDIGIPIHLPAAWNIIQNHHERLIDLPYAEWQRAPRTIRRYFVQLAGAGLDSRAIALVDWEQKKRWGPAAYVLAGLQAILEPKTKIIAASEGCTETGESILIGNGRFFGGRFKLFPNARLDDGLLDILVYPKVNIGTLFKAGLGMLSDTLHTAAAAISFQSPEFQLHSDSDLEFELDGDNVGRLPARFALLPKSLRVLVPAR